LLVGASTDRFGDLLKGLYVVKGPEELTELSAGIGAVWDRGRFGHRVFSRALSRAKQQRGQSHTRAQELQK